MLLDKNDDREYLYGISYPNDESKLKFMIYM